MRRVRRLWRTVYDAFTSRLSWKLTLSHWLVVILSLIVMGTVTITVIMFGLRSFESPTSLPDDSLAMRDETRVLATSLQTAIRTQSPAQLTATLKRLPPSEHTGTGAFNGGLRPNDLLVVGSPKGKVLASSDPTRFPSGIKLDKLKPSGWGELLHKSAADGKQPKPLLGRDTNMRVLYTAYPILDRTGRVVAALGLRSAPLDVSSSDEPSFPVTLLIAIFTSAFVVLFLASIPALIVSGAAGFVLARMFGRRLRRLEEATEAISRGELDRRVKVTSRDEIGRLGNRFNMLAERLQQVETSRRAFVSNISHDLRTPLAVIRGHVEAQLNPSEDAPRSTPAEALRVIERETNTLDALISDLFTLTRLEEAALPMRTEPVSLAEIAGACVGGISSLALSQGKVAVKSLVSDDLPLVLADRARLGQVLNNLLHNALRHTPEGGVIIVEATALPGTDLIEVSVTDTGTGISPDALPHIFDRYYMGEDGGRREGGSGLGLSIVKQLVEAQGGTVGAESGQGEGTRIRFTLQQAR